MESSLEEPVTTPAWAASIGATPTLTKQEIEEIVAWNMMLDGCDFKPTV